MISDEEKRNTYRLGTGRHRLGPREEVRLSVTVPERHLCALLKLRLIKGIQKSEFVTFAIDLALTLPPEEIVRCIEERRNQDL
jgi:hypothetical protein